MCGIAGICSFQEDFLQQRERFDQLLVDMRTSIVHRTTAYGLYDPGKLLVRAEYYLYH